MGSEPSTSSTRSTAYDPWLEDAAVRCWWFYGHACKASFAMILVTLGCPTSQQFEGAGLAQLNRAKCLLWVLVVSKLGLITRHRWLSTFGFDLAVVQRGKRLIGPEKPLSAFYPL